MPSMDQALRFSSRDITVNKTDKTICCQGAYTLEWTRLQDALFIIFKDLDFSLKTMQRL